MFKKCGFVTKYRESLFLKFFMFGLFAASAENVSALDPIYAEADAYIRSGINAGTNYGNKNNLFARVHSNADESYESYLLFDLSSLSGKTVTSAKLVLVERLGSIDTQQVWFVDNDAWDAAAITWNAKPEGAGEAPEFVDEITLAGFAQNETTQQASFDVTSILQREQISGETKVSFKLQGIGQNADPIAKYGASANGDSSLRPKLVVTTTHGAEFDGADQLSQNDELSGNQDSDTGLVSFWIKPTGVNQSSQFIYTNIHRVKIEKTIDNKIYVRAKDNNNPSDEVFGVTSNSVLTADQWHHVLIAWDSGTASPYVKIYINDELDSASGSAAAQTVDSALGRAYIGFDQNANNSYLQACVADFYMTFSGTLNIDDETERRKFISSEGMPVDIGSDVSLPLGSQPLIFLSNHDSNFAVNEGSGGNFDNYANANFSDCSELIYIDSNNPPTISGTPAAIAPEDSPYSFTPTASDVDVGDSLSFSITNQPSWASFSTTDGTLSGTPVNADVGAYNNISISVSDGIENVALAAFSVTVTNTNDAPTIGGTPATTAPEDSPYSFTPTANDVDVGDSLSFSITDKPSWASFSTTDGTLSGTPVNADVGNYANISISVSDGIENVALAAFSVTVTNTNDAPTIGGIPATTAPEDSPYSFTPTANDVDVGDSLSFSITDKPSWASFSTTDGTLSGTPVNADVGNYANISISVSDGTESVALAAFSVTVTNTNDAPTIGGTPATTVAEDSAYSFTPTASDMDVGDSLSFSITNQPSWASFNATDGTLSGTPVNADVGNYANISISVSDGTESVTLAPFSVAVTGTNSAPTADAGPDQVVNYNDTVFFSGSGSSDPDQDVLSYQWALVSQPGGSVVTLNNPNSVGPHFTPDHTGDYTIELVVNDGAVDSVADEVTISVHGLPLDMAAAGFIDVTTYSGVDKNGGSLSTNGIKAAIADGISQGKAIFFPSGTYLVDETLECMQPAATNKDDDHTKHHPGCVLIGSTQGTRPVIKLDTNSSGFGDASDPAATPPSIKPVVHFWREQVGGGGTAEDEDGSRNYNQIIRNIDIDLNHNAGAVGIRHWAAEGSAIQEVYVDAEGAFAGVYNYPTSGGTVVNLHVFKGEYGIYSTKARGGAAVFAGLRLVDQVVEPIRYDGSNYPLTIVGFEIRSESAPIFNLARQGNAAMDHLALIDGTLKLKNNPTGTILSNKNRTIYMKNVFVKGASTIVNNANEGVSLAVPAGGYTPNGWAHLDEYIYVAVQDTALDVDAVLDGVPVVGQGTIKEAWNVSPEDPPTDFELQHSYPEAMCSFENPFAVNVKDFVDPSDPDDTEAFGRAIAASDIVLLPVGNYMVSGTIELNPQTQLCGVGNTLSVIEAAPSWSLSSGEAPMIKVDDAPAAAVFLADFQTRTYLTSNRIYNLSWGAGRNSVVRNVLHSHNTPDSFYPNNVEFDPDDHTIALSRVRISGSGGGRWYGHMSGGVAWDCLNSGCRLMLIENTSEPLSFYMYQSQFLKVDGGPMTELTNAHNVTFYGIKSETVKPCSEAKHDGGKNCKGDQVVPIFSTNWPIVMGINGNSSAIQVYGHEGPSQAKPGRGLFELSNTSDVTLVNFGRRNGIDEKHPENTWYFIKDFDYQPPTEMGAHRFTGFLRRSPQ